MQRFLILFFLLAAGAATVSGQTKTASTKAQQASTKALPAATKAQPTPAVPKKSIAEQVTSSYAYPILNVEGLYAANFGEMRPGHFHAGIDIKTEGAEGRPIVAVGDGCITRITLSPGGYGRALYLRLADGTTAVYGHLSQFRDDLEERIRYERLRNRKNTADLWFGIGEFPVSKGETIARSGNSGSSFGPHLHFELRDASGKYLNVVREGIYRPADNIPPVIMRLHYIEIDSLQGVPVQAPRRTFNVALQGAGRYKLQPDVAVEVGRKGYFVLEASDRRNGVQNTFGLYRASLAVDAEPVFEYRQDGFRPEHSRCCDAVSYYPLQTTTRNEAIRLAQVDEAPDLFYTAIKERGLVRTGERQTRRIRIEAEDDCGNLSHIEFDIKGVAETFRATADSTAIALYPQQAGTVRIGNEFTLKIPAGALYEPIFCTPQNCGTPKAPVGVVVLSPAYRGLDNSVPLRQSVTVSVRASVPENLRSRTVLAARGTSGSLSYIGGKFADGTVTARTRSTGQLLVVADTVPPRVAPLFKEGADLQGSSRLRFRIGDNFSGIGQYTLRIDGEWVASDRLPVQNILYHEFTTSAARRRHTFRLTVSDNCGNTTSYDGTFYR